MGQVSRAAKAGLVLLLAGGCAIGAPSTFTLNSASVDSVYTCPLGAADAPYKLQATIDVRNGTSSTVTIKSVAAVMTLADVKGKWLEPVGDKYQAGDVTFTPATVGAGNTTSLKVTIPSTCTNGKTPSATAAYGEYKVALTVATSAGTQTISTRNRHRIVAASGSRT
ncbi:MAG TPA: hypothetical protein VGS16_03710 [Candidatus Dormibacteraeota bacterium]|nr:hypothetical protein [Candidatus Dormibacteraeota bacterium]